MESTVKIQNWAKLFSNLSQDEGLFVKSGPFVFEEISCRWPFVSEAIYCPSFENTLQVTELACIYHGQNTYKL